MRQKMRTRNIKNGLLFIILTFSLLNLNILQITSNEDLDQHLSTIKASTANEVYVPFENSFFDEASGCYNQNYGVEIISNALNGSFSAEIDSTSDYTKWNPSDPLSEGYIAFTVQLASLADGYLICGVENTYEDWAHLGIRLYAGRLQALHRSGGEWTSALMNTFDLDLVTIYRIVYKWDIDGRALYINGILEDSDNEGAIIDEAQKFGLGKVATSTSGISARGIYDDLHFVQGRGLTVPSYDLFYVNEGPISDDEPTITDDEPTDDETTDNTPTNGISNDGLEFGLIIGLVLAGITLIGVWTYSSNKRKTQITQRDENSINSHLTRVNFQPEFANIKLNSPPKRRILEENILNHEKVMKLQKMLKVSKRIRLDLMQETLGLTKKQFNDNLFDWAEDFGFQIDGDFVIVNQDNMDNFLNSLDSAFEDWETQEFTKAHKI
jgi:hypothetical protein